MGIFDKNIHMNGAGTTYQAFLDLADAAEREGGRPLTARKIKALVENAIRSRPQDFPFLTKYYLNAD